MNDFNFSQTSKTILIALSLLVCCKEFKHNSLSDLDMPKEAEIRIDSFFTEAIDNGEIPGAVALIAYKGNILFHQAYGYKNIEIKDSQKKDDIFRLASMTKGLTAAAILQLNEKKMLKLDDDLAQYIPEFNNLKILDTVFHDSTFLSHPATKRITIRHLLTHSSGIGYGFQNENYNKLIIHNQVSEGFCEDERTSLENTKKIAMLPLLKEPGEGFIYSLSYDVLGTLIEVITGMRYDAYIEKFLLEPLEMNNSYFIIPIKERTKLVKVYEPTADSTGLIPTTYQYINYPLLDNRNFYSGGADLCGTAEDYSHFLQMLMNGGIYGQKKILSSESVKMMLSKQTPFDDGDADQGFAAWVTNGKGAQNRPMSVGSYEFGGFFDTYSWADPKMNYNAVLLLQMYPNNDADIHGKFQNLIYDLMNGLNSKKQ